MNDGINGAGIALLIFFSPVLLAVAALILAIPFFAVAGMITDPSWGAFIWLVLVGFAYRWLLRGSVGDWKRVCAKYHE